MNRILLVLLFFCTSVLPAQERKGIVLNSRTSHPVQQCLIIIKGRSEAFISDDKGEFYFPSGRENVSLVFTLLGYTTAEYNLSVYKKDTFYITPKDVQLKEVTVSAEKKSILNAGNPEPVLDFDLLNDGLAVLTAGEPYNELRLINESGNPLSRLKVDSHSNHLNHDCIGNLQLFSHDSVWQVFYDYTRLKTLDAFPADTFYKVLGNCICMSNRNYYFKHDSYRNLRTNYFYYSEDSKGKPNELVVFQDTAKIRGFESDYNLQYFLKVRRESHYSMYNEPVDVIIKNMEQYREELPLDWAYVTWLGKMETQMIKADTNTLIVNFTDTCIHTVSKRNEVSYRCRMEAFKKEVIPHVYVDAENGEAYLTGFSGNTLTFIRFSLENGKEISRTEVLNVPYLPKKIIIKGGSAFFIQRNLADDQVYKIIRYSLN
jgi:hypothetical protein